MHFLTNLSTINFNRLLFKPASKANKPPTVPSAAPANAVLNEEPRAAEPIPEPPPKL
jgi:hypothetical protein